MAFERIPQSVTRRVLLKAYLASDHISDATGKTIAVVISKNGAAFGNPSAGATNATEIGNGWYYVDLSTTDTGTAGPLITRGTVATIDNSEVAMTVVDAHNAGFDGVPAVIAGASTGLPLSVDSSGRVDVLKINGTSQTARDIGASVLLSSGTGTGQLDFTSGVVKSNLAQILGTALTETAGLLAGGFKKFFNVGSPTLTCLGTDQTGDSFARIGVAGVGLTNLGDTRIANLDATISSRTKPADTQAAVTLVTTTTTTTNLTNAPTAGDFTATMKTSLNAATPASITGAVGSVTGNVGGNVTGSVGSVVGAVGSVTGTVGSVTGNVGGNVAGSVGSVTAGVTLTSSERNSTADALLNRDFTLVSDTNTRTLLNATRFLRNKWAISANTLTVYKEDGVTTAWTGTVGDDASAQPIVNLTVT